MPEFAPALPHGRLEEVFPDVFFVTGTMKTVLMGAHWHFSRNMVVVRDGQALSLINTVRLDEVGLAQLDALGEVKNVLRIGALHGLDDAFYVQRYQARLWALPGMSHAPGLEPHQLLSEDGEQPFGGCSTFVFRHTQLPEAIVRIDRAGGILVACDALQNWLAPDAFFSEESRQTMAEMGFFQEANIGPVWQQVNAPQAADFQRLQALPFRHALCGHGQPLRERAHEAYAQRFAQVFGE